MHTLLRAFLLAVIFSPAACWAQAQQVPPDGIKVQDLRAGGDEKKRYFVHQRLAEAPKEGWRALFVLPGGPGNAEFQPFVTNIAKQALPANYLVVQLVAPVWSPEQAQNAVWADEKPPVREAKFTTTDFFLKVREEVGKAHKIDPRHVFTLTWSSSGTSGYRFSLLPKTGVTGSFVAMSVFRPEWLPSLTKAKGHPYYLYHSPTDPIPLTHAQNAQAALQKAGATVELKTYEGGHGWHGDVFGDIRKGIEWLEGQVAKGGKRPATGR